MDMRSSRKKLEEVAHSSQELKNMFLRMSDNEKEEFRIGYHANVDVDELARILFDWSEEQHLRQHNENE